MFSAPIIYILSSKSSFVVFVVPLKVESLKTLLLITCSHGIILIKRINLRKIPDLLCFIAQVAWALIHPSCNISQRRKCLKKFFTIRRDCFVWFYQNHFQTLNDSILIILSINAIDFDKTVCVWERKRFAFHI